MTELWRYPVKSFGGEAVESSPVEPWGLEGDRRWGVVGPDGFPVTARECHELLGLTASQVDEETIRLTARDGDSILVETPLGVPVVPVGHSRQGFAPPADQDVSEWVSQHAGRDLRLVWQEDPSVRRISGAHGGEEGESLSLADTGPLLLTSEASLTRLSDWILEGGGEPVPMSRFRPNVVVDGDEPFAEDGWGFVTIGEVRYRRTELCDRCVMTQIDTGTLQTGKEPIRTLAQHRRWDGTTWFGIRLVPVGLEGGPAQVAVGDEVVADEETS
ncbi:Flavodoxin reductases (ferredoxin-NADPH reductases) family 1 [Serinicoccus hydrothermalis]|uniref:Flavodoxin reductases (Ferredoxin-NADPH reductases) family 1 n=1 Tax=Serinicoccus hydrothermalis TaxID=1758689 RepID=A0A1B1NDX3_9MICO|nr:Flavodoxin reductases (ferredoxin-NADPH reductases) family 1 [Serinicoccus hydrothermalis]